MYRYREERDRHPQSPEGDQHIPSTLFCHRAEWREWLKLGPCPHILGVHGHQGREAKQGPQAQQPRLSGFSLNKGGLSLRTESSSLAPTATLHPSARQTPVPVGTPESFTHTLPSKYQAHVCSLLPWRRSGVKV